MQWWWTLHTRHLLRLAWRWCHAFHRASSCVTVESCAPTGCCGTASSSASTSLYLPGLSEIQHLTLHVCFQPPNASLRWFKMVLYGSLWAYRHGLYMVFNRDEAGIVNNGESCDKNGDSMETWWIVNGRWVSYYSSKTLVSFWLQELWFMIPETSQNYMFEFWVYLLLSGHRTVLLGNRWPI